MKIVIFGMGSIGQRHAKILLEQYNHDVFAFRSNKDSSPNELGIKELFSWDEVKELKADIAFITNPTANHMEVALQCASLGMHLFIEKPLSHNCDHIAELQTQCEDKQLTCYTAYCLRFSPVIQKVSELLAGKRVYHVRIVCSSYLHHWREEENLLKSYSVYKDQGGGILQIACS